MQDSPQDIDRLERRLRGAEDELRQRYCNLGKSIMETAEAESQGINGLVDEVIELRQRLSAIRAEISCPACLCMNAPDSRYCRSCGAQLPGTNITSAKEKG